LGLPFANSLALIVDLRKLIYLIRNKMGEAYLNPIQSTK
jgi:hypothetical protein